MDNIIFVWAERRTDSVLVSAGTIIKQSLNAEVDFTGLGMSRFQWKWSADDGNEVAFSVQCHVVKATENGSMALKWIVMVRVRAGYPVGLSQHLHQDWSKMTARIEQQLAV